MLAIRLKPMGKKGQKSFRIIVSEKKKDVFGDYLENLGTVNPMTNPRSIQLNEERIRHWLSNGAQPSGTVHNILVDAKIIEGPKVKVSRPHKKKRKGEEDETAPPADKSAGDNAEEKNKDKKEGAPVEKPADDKPTDGNDEKPSEEKPEEKPEAKTEDSKE